MIAGVLCHKLLYDGEAYLEAFQRVQIREESVGRRLHQIGA